MNEYSNLHTIFNFKDISYLKKNQYFSLLSKKDSHNRCILDVGLSAAMDVEFAERFDTSSFRDLPKPTVFQ